MKIILLICFVFSFNTIFSQNAQISPGVLWNDINGEQINAHGGCVVFNNGYYYWFGEDRTGQSPTESVAINPKTYIIGKDWDSH